MMNSIRALLLSLVFALSFVAAAHGQTVMDMKGTSRAALDIGIGSGKLTLTNTAGTLSLTSGLTVSAGTINFSGATVSNGGTFTTVDINGGTIDGTAIGGAAVSTGAFSTLSATGVITSTLSTGTAPFTIASTTKVANLNVEQVDTFSLTGGSNGGIVYQQGSANMQATAAGTSGQLVVSGGSGAPTFLGLTSANLYVGNGSNVPAGVAMSGDTTISNTGVVTIASGAITASEIAASTVTAAMLANAVADEVVIAAASAGAEAANVIRVTLQAKDVQGNNVSGVKMVAWNLSDSASSATETAQAPVPAYVNGASWQIVTATKKEQAFTDANGALVLDVTLVGDLTIHAVFALGGKVYSQTLDFN